MIFHFSQKHQFTETVQNLVNISFIYMFIRLDRNDQQQFIFQEATRSLLTSFWWYLIASLSLARSRHSRGSSSSLWSSRWLRMVSSSRELRAWSSRSLAKSLHCWESSSYSCRNSFSTLLSSFSSQPSLKAVRMGSSLERAMREGLASAL